MPEGPSIVILKEQIKQFKGKKIINIGGDAEIDYGPILNKTVADIKSWGKHLLICFHDSFIRIHLLMFGTYLINDKKSLKPRLHLEFKNGLLNFYTCSVKYIQENLEEVYDWQTDLMSEEWNPNKILNLVKLQPYTLVCDVLLDQQVFTGSGNIIKNEVLYRVKIHPDALIKDVPLKKLKALIMETANYAFEFYEQKKKNTLQDHWLIYQKKICPKCKSPIEIKDTGKTKRKSFFCVNCQSLFKR